MIVYCLMVRCNDGWNLDSVHKTQGGLLDHLDEFLIYDNDSPHPDHFEFYFEFISAKNEYKKEFPTKYVDYFYDWVIEEREVLDV